MHMSAGHVIKANHININEELDNIYGNCTVVRESDSEIGNLSAPEIEPATSAGGRFANLIAIRYLTGQALVTWARPLVLHLSQYTL